MEKYLRTNIENEAALSLEILSEQIPKVKIDLYRWKWVILFLHNTLQNFMVLALRGTNNLKVVNKKDADKWLKAYYNNEDTLPVCRLDNFLNLYQKIKTNSMCQYVNSKKYIPNKDEDFYVKKLNQLRNDFIHFVPKSWSIQLVGLPGLCLDCLSIIQFLIFESGNIIFYNDLYDTASKYLNVSIRELEIIRQIYNNK
ncbi:MAG: hypothetical protein KAW56_09340 [Candidatus Marinimicrobia bacterium]|nr:hypothetical protein [Candidatus Neomarinimicrobiota bacterium]